MKNKQKETRKRTNPRVSMTSAERDEARRSYEAGEPMLTISKRMGIPRTSIIRYKDLEQWTCKLSVDQVLARVSVSSPTDRAVQAVQAQVIDIATRRTVERLEKAGTINEHADRIAQCLEMQAELAYELQCYVLDMVRRARRGEIQPGERQSEADVLNALVSAASRAVATAREMSGKRPGDASLSGALHEGPIEIIQTRLNPVMIRVNERGRAIKSESENEAA